MTGMRSCKQGGRPAFTLVEILVVIAIIAILVAISVPAVMSALGKGKDVQTKNDIGAMEFSMSAARNGLGGTPYLPSYLILREDNAYYNTTTGQVLPQYVTTVAALKRAFGKNISLMPPATIDWNGDGIISTGTTGDLVLEGKHCLVFWLGGIPVLGASGVQGFSTNPQNPAAATIAGSTRKGPYYPDFKTNRLVKDANGFFYYLDPYMQLPYLYFSCGPAGNDYVLGQQYAAGGAVQTVSGDCPSIGVLPYYQGTGTSLRFMNPNSFQIISAGKNGVFAPGGQWNSTMGTMDATVPPAPSDDWSNFSSVVLGRPAS